MALRLLDKVPLLRDAKLMQRYARYLHTAEFKIDPILWIIFSITISILVGIVTWVVTGRLLGLEQNMQFGALLFLVFLDLLIGYPYLKAQQKIDQIEEALPDALRQMADTLRAGGTYEYALREIATSEYGPLRKEMNEVLRKLEEGENFENALKTLSYNIDSRLVQRTVTIIIDSVNAGAGLANVLEQISEDVRAAHRIGKERKARTVMQVIFMFAAGGAVAPMIFGFVSTVSDVLIRAASSVASTEEQTIAVNALGTINLSIQGYILIESIATALMISLMRDGKMGKSIIYFPILLLIAYTCYIAAILASAAIVGGL
ncbi:MAG TPA: type II secretion system F family protein [archaeon]|nr:type II secretion system F family protein [archaeon]